MARFGVLFRALDDLVLVLGRSVDRVEAERLGPRVANVVASACGNDHCEIVHHWIFATVDVDAGLRIGRFTGSASDSASGLFDMTVVPVIASRHFSQTSHMSLALYIYAPTGSYDPDALANVSLNNWTYSPTIGYTQLDQGGTLEFSTVAAVDLYTENHATDYQNGAVFRLDALLIKRTKSGWGFGAAGGWIQQLEDDTGPTADRLNGFKGHSLAIGPIATYKTGKVEFSARWLKEFDVKNRLEGNPVMLTGTIVF